MMDISCDSNDRQQSRISASAPYDSLVQRVFSVQEVCNEGLVYDGDRNGGLSIRFGKAAALQNRHLQRPEEIWTHSGQTHARSHRYCQIRRNWFPFHPHVSYYSFSLKGNFTRERRIFHSRKSFKAGQKRVKELNLLLDFWKIGVHQRDTRSEQMTGIESG